jgi:glyoxylase-like metal-dependent hydrolase (beta-lactamase superfamily II)
MKEKFISKKINKDIFQVNEPWNVEGCNIYLFKNENSCLIFDSGIGLFSLKNYLEEIKITTFLIALTHSHFDHIGGIADFTKEECVIPKIIIDSMEDRDNWGLEYFKAENLDQSLLVDLTSKTTQQICDDFSIQMPAIVPIEKDVITFFDYRFKIMHLGGHTADSCVYYDAQHKILVTGDLLYDGEIYATCRSSNKEQFASALKVISELDFDLVLPGHNQVMNREEALQVIKKWLKDLA